MTEKITTATTAQLEAQLTTENWKARIILGILGAGGAILTLGHFPGWVPTTTEVVNGVEYTIPGYWKPIGDALFAWTGVLVAAIAGAWRTRSK